MISITFPDNSVKQFEKNISCLAIATNISQSLAKKCIVAMVNNTIVDLSYKIDKDSAIKFITSDTKNEDEKKILLDTFRHSCAHLLAQAVKEIYENKVQVTIGPVIENGFYYDFKMNDSMFSTEDFPKIELKMKEIANRKLEITRLEIDKSDAIEFFKSINENFKCKIIEEIIK